MPRKIKVLGVRTHYKGTDGKTRLSAVDWWRVQNPLSELKKHTDWEIKFVNRIVNPGKFEDFQWELIGQTYDVIYTSYLHTPKAYAYLRATCAKNNCIHIMDLDDNIFEVDENNPAYLIYHSGSKELESATIILHDLDYLSVSTPYLKEVCEKYAGRTKKTVVLPNFINPQWYRYEPRRVPNSGEKIIIGYQGSSTHFIDLFKTGFIWALREIMKKYPQVHFCVVGSPMEEFKQYLPQDRLIMRGGHRDFRRWVKELWPELPFNIGVAPLFPNGFNRAKSSIKYYEYSLRKIPGIYSFVEPYIQVVQENKTGFLAKDEFEWGEKLSWLIENGILRRKMADEARKDVLANYTIQSHWQLWKDFIEEAVNEKRK